MPSLVNATTGAIAGQLRKSLTIKFAKESAKDAKETNTVRNIVQIKGGAFDEPNAPERRVLYCRVTRRVRLFPVSAMYKLLAVVPAVKGNTATPQG